MHSVVPEVSTVPACLVAWFLPVVVLVRLRRSRTGQFHMGQAVVAVVVVGHGVVLSVVLEEDQVVAVVVVVMRHSASSVRLAW